MADTEYISRIGHAILACQATKEREQVTFVTTLSDPVQAVMTSDFGCGRNQCLPSPPTRFSLRVRQECTDSDRLEPPYETLAILE